MALADTVSASSETREIISFFIMKYFNIVNIYVLVMSVWITELQRCVVSVHPFLILHHIANVTIIIHE